MGEIYYIVTFFNTTDAMAFKKRCEMNAVAGRLMPIPQGLEAGCGQVWCAPLTARRELTTLLDDPQVAHCEVTLYEV